ncbi:hypothetical protein TPAU25S_04120 [Tsukamurella paurometabola]|nr:Uncharacterised protein [Tsukamurella paurometabola]
MFTSARVINTENRLIEATKTPVVYMSTDTDFAAALALVHEREGSSPALSSGPSPGTSRTPELSSRSVSVPPAPARRRH